MKKPLVFAGMALISIGCAKQQNPIKNYSDVPVTPPYEEKPVVIEEAREQKYAVCGFVIEAPSTIVVVEDSSANSKVLVRGVRAKTKIQLAGAPEGTRIEKTGSENGAEVFRLNVQGSGVAIPSNADYATLEFEIVPESVDPALRCSEKVGVVAIRNKTTPVITRVSRLPRIDVSQKAELTVNVDVQAPGLKDVANLVAIARFDHSADSKENPVLNLSRAIYQPDAATPTGGDRYRIVLKLDPKTLEHIFEKELPKEFKKTEIEGLFSVGVFNKDTNKMSPEENVVAKIRVQKNETPIAQVEEKKP